MTVTILDILLPTNDITFNSIKCKKDDNMRPSTNKVRYLCTYDKYCIPIDVRLAKIKSNELIEIVLSASEIGEANLIKCDKRLMNEALSIAARLAIEIDSHISKTLTKYYGGLKNRLLKYVKEVKIGGTEPVSITFGRGREEEFSYAEKEERLRLSIKVGTFTKLVITD